jgi:hypothetical protein
VELINAFWDQIENVKDKFGLDSATIETNRVESLNQFKTVAIETDGWIKASQDDPHEFHLTPAELGLGDIYVYDVGNMLCLELNDASEFLEVLGGNAISVTRLIAETVGAKLLPHADTIKFVMPGPSFVDVTKARKDTASLRLLSRQDIQETIGGGRIAVLLLGDAPNDDHLNLTEQDFAKLDMEVVAIPIYVGTDEAAVEDFNTRPITTTPTEADGGVLAQRAASQMPGRDLSEVIVAEKATDEQGIAPEGPKELIRDLLEFGIDVTKDRKHWFDGVPLGVDWVMDGLRDPEIRPIVKDLEDMLEAQLVYPLEDVIRLPALSTEGTHTEGVYVALIELKGEVGLEVRPAVIKIISEASEEKARWEYESAQVLDTAGAHPRFYGVVKDGSGNISGYAMQMGIGESCTNITLTAVHHNKYFKQWKGCMIRYIDTGLSGLTDFLITRTDELIGMDAGGAKILERRYKEKYDAYVARMDESRQKPQTSRAWSRQRRLD